eukprot:TRINITY_DN19819_c0_g1_i1.p1 TRINITY_DN19819_c0_g1~~TRINITY_DN19819_c0_g1_i1.p1  ORF type:complete len:117 (+),score=10.05 TRINITY_DN19819_c0_g1_i1:87-437(+)
MTLNKSSLLFGRSPHWPVSVLFSQDMAMLKQPHPPCGEHPYYHIHEEKKGFPFLLFETTSVLVVLLEYNKCLKKTKNSSKKENKGRKGQHPRLYSSTSGEEMPPKTKQFPFCKQHN